MKDLIVEACDNPELFQELLTTFPLDLLVAEAALLNPPYPEKFEQLLRESQSYRVYNNVRGWVEGCTFEGTLNVSGGAWLFKDAIGNHVYCWDTNNFSPPLLRPAPAPTSSKRSYKSGDAIDLQFAPGWWLPGYLYVAPAGTLVDINTGIHSLHHRVSNQFGQQLPTLFSDSNIRSSKSMSENKTNLGDRIIQTGNLARRSEL